MFMEGSTYYSYGQYSGSTDYSGSDAATVLQNTINTLNTAGGGIIYIKRGTYIITTTISMKSNIALIGETCGFEHPWPPAFSVPVTVLKLGDNVNDELLVAAGENPDGFTEPYTLRDIAFNGNKDNQTVSVNMVDLTLGRIGTIDNCFFFYAKQDGLVVNYALVTNCRFALCGRSCVHLIVDSFFANNGAYSGNTTAGNENYSTVEAWSYNFVYNNHIYDIYNPPNPETGTGSGLYVNNNNSVIGNKIRDCIRHGIKVGGNDNIITGNLVWDNSRGSIGGYDGIYVSGSNNSGSNNIITENRCYDDEYSGQKNQRYGICTTGSSDYNLIMMNNCSGSQNATFDIYYVGSNNKVAWNIGRYTPTGSA